MARPVGSISIISDSTMQLVLDTRGLRVWKRNGCFHLKTEQHERLISPQKVSSIAVTSQCVLSSAAIQLAITHQIPIYFLNRAGRVEEQLWSASFGPLANRRRQQVLFSLDLAATAWAIDLHQRKMEQQLQVLRYVQNRRPSQADLLTTAMQDIQTIANSLPTHIGSTLAHCADSVRGIEGSMARHYWAMLSAGLPEAFRFETRNRQPATDAFNAALNYAYGMLYAVVETALFAAGLDPYLGIFHADQYDKPTLSYDLIEPFRPWADRLVFDLCLNDEWPADAFETTGEAVRLAKAGKRLLIPRFNGCMAEKADFDQHRAPRRTLIYQFAGSLAQQLDTFSPKS